MKSLFAAVSLALLSGIAFSQTSSPVEKGSTGASAPAASAPAPGPGMGPGMGMGPGAGPRGRMMRFDAGNTPGWSLMTPEERQVHHDKMLSFKTVEECKAYHDEHVKLMAARAKEQGKQVRRTRGDPCAMMQRRGLIK